MTWPRHALEPIRVEGGANVTAIGLWVATAMIMVAALLGFLLAR